MLPAARRRAAGIAATAWLVALATFAAGAPAATPVQLGQAAAFAVFGATTVTSAGTSTISGDLGVSPGTAITGFPPGAGTGILTGTMHAGDSVAAGAHTDLATAYDAAVLVPKTADAAVLDALTLGPGVHRANAALSLAGTLTLDGGGDPNAVFIFQAGSTLTTAAGSFVSLTNGVQACNVFWQVGSSATLGAGSLLRGSILAQTSITVGAGVTIHGRALALDAAVTLDNDTVSAPHCAGDPTLTEPVFGDFSATLDGSAQSTHTTISDWNVSDPSDGARGWEVTMSASPLVTAGPAPVTMTGATLTIAAPAATPVEATNPSTAPAVLGGDIRAGSVKVADAAPGAGLRAWQLAQGATDLALGIPADARAGSYTSTITTTLTPPLAP
jgi:hypothetical protein